MSNRVLEYDRNDLPRALHRAVQLLREEPGPGDLWRHRVMRAIDGAPPTRRPGRRWSIGPLTAIAAGLACALLGGGVTAVLVRGSDRRPNTVGVSQATQVHFAFQAPGAASVSLVGDFNGWNPQALPMRRAADGQTWEVEVPLAPGRYTYAFMVDGALARDPRAPRPADDDFGAPSSVVLVRGS